MIIFVKAPRPGLVKTRLAATLGPAAACEAYCLLVETLLRGLSSLEEVELRFAPDEAAGEILRWRRNSWRMAPQGAGGLGQRLERAFREAFDRGAGRVAVIGSDCPAVTQADVASARSALTAHDVVLGPANDGGYWLIGLRKPHPELFRGIAWSTNRVLAETLDCCAAAGLQVELLRSLADVDTEADWHGFCTGQGRA